MEYVPKPMRKRSILVKPEKKKITMANLANLKSMMKRFERPGAATPETAPEKRGVTASTNASAVNVDSDANLDGLLKKQRTMRRSNSTRDITSVLARSSDPLGSNSMHGSNNSSTATILGAMQRNQLESTSGFLSRSDHAIPGETPDTEVDALGANSSNGRLEYGGFDLMGRRSTARSQSDDGTLVPSGARSVHSLFSSSALIRRKQSGDDTSVMSSASMGGKRRTRRLSMGSKAPEDADTSTSENMRNHLRLNLSNIETGQPSTNLAELRAGLGLPSPSEKAKAATAIEQAVAASDAGTASTTWGGALADLRRSVVSQRALMSASAHDDYDRPMAIMRGIGRRSSIGGMALPPTTLAPHVKKRSSRSRSRGRSQSVQRSSKSTDESKSNESKSSKKKSGDRSETVQRSSKSTDKSKMSGIKSVTKSPEKKGRGRTSKSSDVPPETKASERKGRGRSRSVHGSSKSSGKSGAVPPETKAPDKKSRARGKSTQQRRTSKTAKEQAREKYDYNDFKSDEAAKHEVEAAEAAEKQAAEKLAAGSALGRRRERSQSMSHRMISPEAEILPVAANRSIQTEKNKVDSKDVSTFVTAADPGGFPAWNDNKDDMKDSSGAGDTSDHADFGAAAPWDDDPWGVEEGGDFNPKSVTTKVETTPNVPAVINFGDSDDLFGNESVGIGSSLGRNRGSGHSVGGGSSGSVSSGRGKSLKSMMDTSFGGKASDAGSVSGQSRNNLQGIRRSSVVSAKGPSTGQTLLAVPATKRRSSMTGSGFGGFDNSDVKSVGFDDHLKDQAGGEDSPVTTLAPPFAIAFAGKKVSTQILDADYSQGPAASTGQHVPPPTVAALFAQKLDAAKKFDQARGGSQHLPKAESGQDIAANSAALFAEKFQAAKELDGRSKVSQRLGGTDSEPDLDSNKHKPSNAPKPTSASAFAAQLQAARQDDSMASTRKSSAISVSSCRRQSIERASPSIGKSSASSVSISKTPHRQSMEMAYSPRPNSTAKKMDGVRSNLKYLRRSSLV